MKIAVISNMLGQPWTGSEELWADMAEVALREGHKLDVSLWRWPTVPSKVSALQKAGANVSFRTRPNKVKVLYRMVGQRVKVPYPRFTSTFKKVLDGKPDVICLSQGWLYEFRDHPDLILRLRESKIPLVVVNQANIETTIDDNMRHDTRDFLKRAAKVAFVSEGNLKAAERQLAMSLPNGIVLRNPVNLSSLDVVPWPERLKDDPWSMACVGRLECGHKSQDVLLEALGTPEWRARSWKLRFFGGGKEGHYIQELIDHYGLKEHVEFGGHVNDVREIWAKHHMMVLPSRTEGTPLALVEAMFCGRPALVSCVAGFPEWIDEGKTGFIADAPVALSIRAGLERAWEQRERWHDMGLAAHEAACEKYDPEPGRTLLNVMREVASTKG